MRYGAKYYLPNKEESIFRMEKHYWHARYNYKLIDMLHALL